MSKCCLCFVQTRWSLSGLVMVCSWCLNAVPVTSKCTGYYLAVSTRRQDVQVFFPVSSKPAGYYLECHYVLMMSESFSLLVQTRCLLSVSTCLRDVWMLFPVPSKSAAHYLALSTCLYDFRMAIRSRLNPLLVTRLCKRVFLMFECCFCLYANTPSRYPGKLCFCVVRTC